MTALARSHSSGHEQPAGPLGVWLDVPDPLLAAGLRRWLREAPGFAISATSAAADVIVRTADGAAGLPRHDAHPAGPVVVLADPSPATDANLATSSPEGDPGSVATITRTGLQPGVFLATVRDVARGRHSATPGPAAADLPSDRRAITVLGMLADGHDLNEIATTLYFSERTVKNVLYGYLGEVGARNRVQAVANAIRRGLV